MDIILKIGRLFRFIYPPSLVFILAVPIAFSLIPSINPNADSEHILRQVKVLFFWLPLFSAMYLLSKRRCVLLMLSIPFIIIGTVEILHLFLINATLSEASLFAIFDTNPMEALDYIGMSVDPIHYIIAAGYILGSLALVFNEKSGNIVPAKIQIISLGVLISIVVVVVVKGGNIAFFPVVEAGILYSREISEHTRIAEKRKGLLQNLQPLKDTKALSNEAQTYVLIIGESTNKNHTSVYGYEKKTTPLLQSQKNKLLVYQDVVSPFSLTLYTLRMALTSANKENGKKYYDAFSIIDLARAGGFQTYWISNQPPSDKISVIGRTADQSYFVNLSGLGFRADGLISHDHKVLPHFKKILWSQGKKKLIVVHLMGSHFAYKKRYPEEFNKFTSSRNEKEQLINEYDNAVLYNDFIVSRILSYLEQYNQSSTENIAGLVYLSDHGEEVFDSREYAGHGQADVSRHHVEIPFIVWVSDSYKELNQSKYQEMSKNLTMPYMTDDLFHSILDFMNISSTQLDTTRSLFSRNYIPRKRIIYGKDYDRELKSTRDKVLVMKRGGS